MKNFIGLSHSDSINLNEPVFKNGLQLINDAKLLARQNNSYSSATSLSILGLEEMVKAILILLHANNVKVYKLKGAKRFFTDHKIRHEIVQLIEMGSGLIEMKMKWDKLKKKKKHKTKLRQYFNDVLNGYLAFTSFMDAYSNITEIEKFDSLKQQGFYVDYNDRVLIPSIEINKEIYESVIYNIKSTIKFYKILKIFFHSSINKHLTKPQINEVNEYIKLFIEDAMKKYEFKKYPKLFLDKEQ